MTQTVAQDMNGIVSGTVGTEGWGVQGKEGNIRNPEEEKKRGERWILMGSCEA